MAALSKIVSRIFWGATNHDFIAERSPCEFQESPRDRHFVEVPGFHYKGTFWESFLNQDKNQIARNTIL